MAEARVESLDALKHFRAALLKFSEEARSALASADSEIVRTEHWLKNEQTSFWQMQLRKRTEQVGRWQEAVRMKRLFKDSTGRQQTAVEEEKALKISMRQLEEAELKLVSIRKGLKRLEKQTPLYRGTVQRFASDVTVELPAAGALLEAMLQSLEAYTNLNTPSEATSSAGLATESTWDGLPDVPSIARPTESVEVESAAIPTEAEKESPTSDDATARKA